jgi:DNA-directed RNA polymerase subunit RPC12/RpoP
MTIVAFTFECASCHSKFVSPQTESYGGFILRSSGQGTAVAMDTIEDPVFDEVSRLLREIGAYGGKDESQRADLIQGIAGVACDKDVDGSEFGILTEPRCPACGSREMESWGPTDPPREYEVAVPVVTHNEWASLSRTEKMSMLRARLQKFMAPR